MSGINPLPPIVNDGRILSASWVNQLSECVNSSGNFVYGANVAYWLNPTTQTVTGENVMYSLQHKYNTLRIGLTLLEDSYVHVKLSKSDVYVGTVVVYDNHFTTTGVKEFDIDITNVTGFTLADNELYFAYVEITPDTAGGLNLITMVAEVADNVIAVPSPELATLLQSVVIEADYLNALRSAASGLIAYTVPSSVPFCGVSTNRSWNSTNSVLRWNIKHLSQYLHVSFVHDSDVSDVGFYINGDLIESFGTGNGTVTTAIYDMTDLPNSIAEPAFGSTNEFKFTFDTDSAGTKDFTVYYIWELPYL